MMARFMLLVFVVMWLGLSRRDAGHEGQERNHSYRAYAGLRLDL